MLLLSPMLKLIREILRNRNSAEFFIDSCLFLQEKCPFLIHVLVVFVATVLPTALSLMSVEKDCNFCKIATC